MVNYIVLVKQVPDVNQITDNAFDTETGTLIRSRLSNVINELDTRALAFANDMRNKAGDKNAKIVALSMGPPMAEEVLRYSLSRCADKAVLLTDRALGGADTWATANPLAHSIRRIVKDIFSGNRNYYVIAGMQSVDGDTAQVPVQIAEQLRVPCVTYATHNSYDDGRFIFTRITSGGSQMVSPKQIPAMITIADFEYPLFAGFKRTRWARNFELIRWSNDDIQAPYTGIKGSKTRVLRVFPPGKTARKRKRIEDVSSLAKIVIEELANPSHHKEKEKAARRKEYILPRKRSDCFDRSYEATEKEIDDFNFLAEKLRQQGVKSPDDFSDTVKSKIIKDCQDKLHKKTIQDMLDGFRNTEPSYQGQVWVIAERAQNGLHSGTLELTGKARKLADSLDTEVGVVLAGSNVEKLSSELFAAGADKVYLIESPLLGKFDPWAYHKAVSACIKDYKPQIVLFAATPLGRVLAPMISSGTGCGLTADCTGLEIRDSSRREQIGILMQTRPALGGNIMATICTKDSNSQMATVRPGVFDKPEPDYSRKGEIIRYKADVSDDDISLEIISTESGGAKVNLNADVIVSGGKGMQNRDNYEMLVGKLCDFIRDNLKVSVERGASRAAVEQGFVDRGHQVGQTGTTVGPEMYFALGISGAIQHIIGISNSETIIAVNSDPEAPIFSNCDYYIVANVEEVVPELAEELSKQNTIQV